MSEFNRCIKKAIESSGYTIYSISKTINYDRATLTNQINGQRKMSKDVFVKILNELNITESDKMNLTTLFHMDIFGDYFKTFEEIKNSFSSYSKTSSLNGNLNFGHSNSLLSEVNGNVIEGEALIINAIKEIIKDELKKKGPGIYFNFDEMNTELLIFLQNIYSNFREKLDMKNIVSFTVKDGDNNNNFNKFIKLLPMIIMGYCPYYYFTNNSTITDVSLLFPYYLITSSGIILISSRFRKAIIIHDKSFISVYTDEFMSTLQKCKRFENVSIPFFQIPYVMKECLDTNRDSLICGFNNKLCALPFFTKEHLRIVFSDSTVNHDEISNVLLEVYGSVKDFITFSPVDSINEFIKTGYEAHTANNYASPLPVNARIEILESIRRAIKDGKKYYFIKREDFFCDNLTFDILSDSKIIYLGNEQSNSGNTMCIISTPNMLISKLRAFFKELPKSCYVLSTDESIKMLDSGIIYARSLL